MRRRRPDWRMRPTSGDGRDNITRPERGPLGSGGDVTAAVSHTEATHQPARASSKGGANAVLVRGYGGISLDLGDPAEGFVPNYKVPEA